MFYGVIYLITNLLNGMKYVGQTTRTVEERFYEHKRENFYLGKAIRKYGEENFNIEVIEECETFEQLNEREIFWISYLKCKQPNGYNLTDGGKGINGITEEARIKKSKEMMGNKYALGYHHSDKTRKKMSVAHTGKKFTDEHRANLSAANMGHKVTPETRAKISAKKIGKKLPANSPERRAKISATKRRESPYKNLIAEMNKVNLSYRGFSNILGIASSGVSCKMCGKTKFTVKDISKIVKFFNLPAEYLMQRND